MLPGKETNNHELIRNCTVHQDTAALSYKVLLSLLFPPGQKQLSEEETWKTSCGSKTTLNSSVV